MNFKNDSEKGRRRGMGVGLSGCGVGSYRDLTDKGVHEEAAGKNHRVCIRETYIWIFYRHRDDVGFQ